MDGSSPIPASGAAGGALAPAPDPFAGVEASQAKTEAAMNANQQQTQKILSQQGAAYGKLNDQMIALSAQPQPKINQQQQV